MRLLVAEDDLDLAEVLEAFLTQNNYVVDVVHDGKAAYDWGSTGVYDGFIFDVMMPRMNGFDLVRRLRAEGVDTPVMMLTAKGAKDDRIEGFDAGADDYLPKPFAPDELLSRVRALLRRGGGYTPTVVTFGDVTLDPTASTLVKDGRVEQLSRKELQILELMMRNPSQVYDADRIISQVWEWDNPQEVNVVWVHISNIRKHLKALGSGVGIKALRGLGYRLEYEPGAEA